jgi:hypothetical protein
MYDIMSLVKHNNIFKNETKELPNFSFNNDVAYHFDATKFGLWLKNNLARALKEI